MLDKNYLQIEAFLKRVKSFKKFYFYNNELVNPYILAEYGFIEDQKNQNQSKCEFCRSVIKFDPVDELLQLKHPLDSCLKDHEEDCRFYYKNNVKLFKLCKKTLANQGRQLYKNIYAGYDHFNNQLKQKLIINECEMKYIQNIKTLYQKFDKNYENGQIQIQKLLALFGWKKRGDLELQCEYCGERKYIIEGQQFEFIGNHKMNCYLINQNNWQILLKSIIVEQLQKIEGQFNKTFGQIQAKKIRNQLTTIKKQNFTNTLCKFKLEIEQIRNEYETLQQNFNNNEEINQSQQEQQDQQLEQKDGKRKRSNKQIFKQLCQIGDNIQEIIKCCIKKVKID